MLFPYRHTKYLMNKVPYVVNFLSTVVKNSIDITVKNSLGKFYYYNVEAEGSLTSTEFSIHTSLNNHLRHITPADSTTMHYVRPNSGFLPPEILELTEDGDFVQIMIRNDIFTNTYTIAENYLPFLVSSLTTQINWLLSRTITEVTSKVVTPVYSEDAPPADPILLGDGLNPGDEF